MSSYAVRLTYSPAPDAAGAAPTGEDLEQLVTAARELQCMTGSGRLYEDVQLVDGVVRFHIRLDPAPEYGAANIARGLASRAFSNARTPGELREVDCVSD